MTNLGCRGTEGFLVNCSFSTNTQFDTHAEDAGVRCVTSEMHVTTSVPIIDRAYIVVGANY